MKLTFVSDVSETRELPKTTNNSFSFFINIR